MTLSNIIPPLACMATGITFFLGFLPVAKVPSRFFVLHCVIVATMWILILIQIQNSLFLLITGACAMAWHNFRINKGPTGKMFLALASGLGVGFGLFRYGTVIPPAALPLSWNYLWVMSVLFGSAVLGSCYVALMVGSDYAKNESIGKDVFERCLRIFLTTLALRAVLFFAVTASIWSQGEDSVLRQMWFDRSQLGIVVISRITMGLIIPACITVWGLIQLRDNPKSFKFMPFYVVIFLVLWGEMSAYRLGF